MPNHVALAVITCFFIVVGVAPYGVSVDLTYPLLHLSLDLSLQYVGLIVALSLLLGWRWVAVGRWARIGGRLATWALLVVVMTQICSTFAGLFSGSGTFQFSVLWPALTGHSPVMFLIIGGAICSYLFWQSRILARPPRNASSYHGVV
jgi:hypothetical protein